MQALNAWIKHIVLLILFATFLELLLPNNSYKKFVKVVMGLLVLQAVLRPVVDLVQNPWKDVMSREVTSRNITASPQEIANQSGKFQREKDRLTMDQYRKELAKQIRVLALSVDGVTEAKADIALNEDKSMNDYGMIKGIRLSVTSGKQAQEKTLIEPVKQVEIDNDKTPAVLPALNERTKEQLKRIITEFYHLRADQVAIVD